MWARSGDNNDFIGFLAILCYGVNGIAYVKVDIIAVQKVYTILMESIMRLKTYQSRQDGHKRVDIFHQISAMTVCNQFRDTILNIRTKSYLEIFFSLKDLHWHY